MAKKKKKIKPVENPFDLNIKEQVKKTFTIDQNAKAPKLGQTFPGSIITGVKTIVNLPAIAAKNAQRLAYNLTGNSEAANEVRPLYKFTNENVINGMQGLEAPYRRITEPMVASLIAAQQMFRNPRAHFLNPSKVFETFNRSYLAAQGNREDLEWYRNAANPVTFGQAINAVLANNINNPEIPDLLDSEAVQRYYVYDPRSEYMDLVNPTPGKTASGAVDFMALLVLDPLNWIPGPKGVQKLSTAGKAAENTVDWSAKGLKQLKSGDIKRIVEQADAAGREDLADFVLLLDEIGNDNANKLIDSYVFYGTPEFKETASYVKNFFYDYESIAKELPEEDIAKIEGLGDVKYFVQDGDVFAASDETILKWVYPYTNSKGKVVEGYWRESLLFPRTTIDEAQLRLGNDVGEIEDVQFVDEVVQSGKNIQAPAGSAIQKKHLGSVFQHSLTPLIRRTGNSKLASTNLTLPVNALELRIASGNIVLNEWLKSANTSFGVFYIGGKRQVVAYDKVSQKFYTLDSGRVRYKPKEVEESQDVLTRITSQDEDLLDAPKLSPRKVQQLVKQLKDGTIKPADLELYKSALGSRYINNELSKEELDLLNTLDGRSTEQLNLLEKVDAELAAEGLAPIGRGIETLDAYKTQRQRNLESEGQPTDDYLEDFYKLLTEAPEGTFDEYGDLADLSAFTSAEAKLSDGATISGPLETPKVKRGKRELIWKEQSNFRIDDAEGYEVLYHSPIDGSIMAAIVPDNFTIVKPGLDAMGKPQLPLLKRVDRIPTSSIKSPGTVSGEGFYSFDTAGQIVPLGQAKSSYDRLRETLVRASMRVQENKEAAIRRVIKDVRIKSQGKTIDDLIDSVERQIDQLEPEYLKVKSLERELDKKTSGGFLKELTPEEFAAYKTIKKYNRLKERRQSLAEEASIMDQLPKTPTENGFYFKVTQVDDQVSIDLIRRTLDWDSYDVLSRQLVRPQLDEVIGSWKMTKYELNKVNFLSQKMGGYTTDWDLFRALNTGDEDLYTLNASEVANFAGRKFKGKKAFRIRDYRRTINKLRKERGAEPFKSQEDFTYGYDELIKEQARVEWQQANKALNWAKSVLDNPNASAANKTYAKKLFDDMTEKIVEIEDQLAKDVDLINRIIAQEILPEQLDPGIWWRIYGEVPKPEKYLESFLRALNEARGTKVALEDDAIKTLDNLDNPYPVKEVDEWSDDPISMNNAEDGPLPEGVLDAINKKKTDELLDIYTTGNSQKTKPNPPKKGLSSTFSTKINYGEIKSDPNGIFVFGSNLQGIHGAGAAKTAAVEYGAERGVGEGLTGRSYALPTKKGPYENMTIEEVAEGIKKFIQFAEDNPDKTFYVTSFGTKRAGFTPEQIAQLFDEIPNNVVFTNEPNGSKNILGQAIENKTTSKIEKVELPSKDTIRKYLGFSQKENIDKTDLDIISEVVLGSSPSFNKGVKYYLTESNKYVLDAIIEIILKLKPSDVLDGKIPSKERTFLYDVINRQKDIEIKSIKNNDKAMKEMFAPNLTDEDEMLSIDILGDEMKPQIEKIIVDIVSKISE